MTRNHSRSSVFAGLCFYVIILIAGFTNKQPSGSIHLEKITESRAEKDFKRSKFNYTYAIFERGLFN